MRRNNLSPEPPFHRYQTRPYSSNRQVNLRTQTRRPRQIRVEDPTHRKDPKPAGRKGLVQRVQLQQVPAMAAHRLRQDHLHRFRHHRTPQPRPPLPLPADVGCRKRRLDLQLRRDGDRALELHVRAADGSPERDRLVQRRRPGVPERGVRVVAPAAEAREFLEEPLVQLLGRGEYEEQFVRVGPSEAVRDPLFGSEAVALLQGL